MRKIEEQLRRLPQAQPSGDLDGAMEALFDRAPTVRRGVPLSACVLACLACLLIGFGLARLGRGPSPGAASLPIPSEPVAPPGGEVRVACVLPASGKMSGLFAREPVHEPSHFFNRSMQIVSTHVHEGAPR